MKKVFFLVLIVLLVLAFVIGYNTYNFKVERKVVEPIEAIKIDSLAKERIVKAISIRTVSFENEEDFDSIQFELFNDFLEEQYPLLHQSSEHKIFNNYSHLYHIKGRKPDSSPIVLMGHLDVVPIASPALWTVHPFAEGIQRDSIFGRGCIDDKGALISILEAVEYLLKDGFTHDRDIYLAFGHDEEVSGKRGAAEISAYLKDSNIKPHFVLDEGGAITQGLVPGVDQNTALIGIAEKGYASFELVTQMAGGHSSQPSKETSIDVLARAVSQLKQNPFPRKITPVLSSFMDQVGPHLDLKGRMAFANTWLFESMILDEYEKTNQGNANIRTTTSPTIFEAGIKDNVIPTESRAVVNFRILPGETIETVRERIVTTINDDRVQIRLSGEGFDPSPVSPIDHESYQMITKSIHEIFSNTITCSNLVIGATDARYYAKVSPNVYRFTPFKLTPKNINCFHGVDERISVAEFENAIRFYVQLIRNASIIES